jgi:hypothetical protein
MKNKKGDAANISKINPLAVTGANRNGKNSKQIVSSTAGITEKVAKKQQRTCLRCQINPSAFCRICHAYEVSGGDVEKARRSFIKGTKPNQIENDLVIEYAEIG